MASLATSYVQIRGDTTLLRRDIDAAVRSTTFTVRPSLDLTAFRAQFRIFEAVYLRDRTFTVTPTVNHSAASTVINTFLNNTVTNSGRAGRDSGNAFDGGFSGVLGRVLKTTAAKWLLLGVAGTVALVKMLPVIGEIITAAGALGAALPFALAAGAAAAVTFKLALNGVDDALKHVFAHDPTGVKNLEKALAKLAPAARSVILELRDQESAFRGFQQAIQQSFFVPLMGALTGLAQSPALGILKAQLSGIAADGGRAAAGVLAVFKASAESGQLLAILAPAREIFRDLAGTVPGLARAFLVLADAAAPFVLALKDRLIAGLERFMALVDKAAADGRLDRLFRDGLAILSTLGTLLASVGSVVASVFGALASSGQSMLGILAGLVQRLADFLKTAQGQEALATLAAVLGVIGDVLAAVFVPLLPVAAKLIAILGGPLVAAVEKLVGPLGNIADLLARELMVVFVALAPVIERFISLFGDFLVLAITEIAAHIRQMLPTLIELANRLGPQLIPLVEALFKVLFALLPVLPAVTALFLALVPVFLKLIPVMEFMITVSTALWTGIAWGIEHLVVPAVKWLLTEIVGLVAGVVPVLADFRKIWDAVASWFTGTIVPSFKKAVDDVVGFFVGLRDFFAGLIDTVKGWWDAFIGHSWFQDVVVAGFRSAVDAIVGIFVFWRDNVAAVLAVVRAVLTAFVAFFLDVIWTGINAVIGLITGGFTRARDTIGSLWGNIQSTLMAGWNFMRNSVLQPLANFITQTIPNAFQTGVSAVQRLWDRIQGVVANPVRWVIDNVINRVVSVFNTVSRAVGGPTIPSVSSGFASGGLLSSIVNRAFADGGQVFADGGIPRRMSLPGLLHGPGGPREDKIPIWASAGEFIVNAASTKAWRPVLEFINSRSYTSEARRQEDIGMYATGGLVSGITDLFAALSNPAKFVGDQVNGLINRIPGAGVFRDMAAAMGRKLVAALVTKVTSLTAASLGGPGGPTGAGPGFLPWPSSPGAQRGDTGVWRSILNLVRASGIPYSFGNAYRPGDPLWHGSGRAVDLMGYNQDRLASFFLGMQPRILELIHRTSTRDYGISRGRYHAMPTQWPLHRNHVHVAMAEGGLVGKVLERMGLRSFDGGGSWPSGTLGYNSSGRSEQVSTASSMDDVVELLVRLIAAVEAIPPGVGRELFSGATSARTLARAR